MCFWTLLLILASLCHIASPVSLAFWQLWVFVSDFVWLSHYFLSYCTLLVCILCEFYFLFLITLTVFSCLLFPDCFTSPVSFICVYSPSSFKSLLCLFFCISLNKRFVFSNWVLHLGSLFAELGVLHRNQTTTLGTVKHWGTSVNDDWTSESVSCHVGLTAIENDV